MTASCRRNEADCFPFIRRRGASPISKRINTRTITSAARFTIEPITSCLSRVRQRGQGMAEYAFILVLVALVIIVVLIATGSQVRNMYSDITYTLRNQAGL